MALNSINTNIAAYSAQANIGRASTNASTSIARLSSGNRIVKASDDVAALAAGTSLRTLVTTLKTALLNAAQGGSLLQVADGALAQISDILQRQKAIAIQAGSGSLTDTQRGFLDQEFQALTDQIDQIAASTNFNGVTLLNGRLGTSLTLANTDALAALLNASAATGADAGTSADPTVAIQAFDITDGSLKNGTGAAGKLDIVDSGGTVLAGAAYLSVNSAVYGQFENFRISEVVYGTSATISVDLNGVTFSGSYANAGTTVTLNNGNTYLKLGMSAITLTNAGTVNAGIADMQDDFKDTVIQRSSTLNGVDFSGTRLQGVIGLGTTGIAMMKLTDSTKVNISNFSVVASGTADSTILSVNVNGSTLTATNIKDALADGNIVIFDDGKGQFLQIDFTGLDTDFDDLSGAGGDTDQLEDFVAALNTGFARINGTGLNFAIGSTSADNIKVQLTSASSTALFGGSLGVGSAADALAASTALDNAINQATTIRSNVGALQSRFNFASANIESSIQNEDAARGVLLDADVTSESTAYATAQVQLQAGIAVLAQANLLPQNLLKLIQ